jgi:predicted nucleic-acid-binding protein
VIAVDTNVVIRLLTGDDQDQATRARKLFETETIWLPKTVILEAEWVLRRLYGLAKGRVAEALRLLLRSPTSVARMKPQSSKRCAGRRTGWISPTHCTLLLRDRPRALLHSTRI